MNRSRLAAAAAVVLWVQEAPAKTHQVVGRGVAWDPKALRVARGDTVEWKNADVVPHNVRKVVPLEGDEARHLAVQVHSSPGDDGNDHGRLSDVSSCETS